MEHRIFEDTRELERSVTRKIRDLLNIKSDALLCLAAGSTPAGIYRELTRMNEAGDIDFSSAYFVGLDEWVGMGKENSGSCRNFMFDNLFDKININPDHICFFNGGAENLLKECQRVDQFIEDHNGIDFMLLGVGMNGHLGLNEPGVDPVLYSHVNGVDEITRDTARKKYFDHPVTLEEGITLGIQHIKEAKDVVAVMTGRHKAEIARKILKGPVSNEIPASLIRDHGQAVFYLDSEAASLL